MARQTILQTQLIPELVRGPSRHDHFVSLGNFHLCVLLCGHSTLQQLLDFGLLNYLHDVPRLLYSYGRRCDQGKGQGLSSFIQNVAKGPLNEFQDFHDLGLDLNLLGKYKLYINPNQAAMIMFVALYAFEDSYFNIETITFSALICIEMMNILSEVHVIKPAMIITILLTVVMYFVTIITFRSAFQLVYVDFNFLIKVAITSLVCWAPIYIFGVVMGRCDPNQEQKIMRER